MRPLHGRCNSGGTRRVGSRHIQTVTAPIDEYYSGRTFHVLGSTIAGIGVSARIVESIRSVNDTEGVPRVHIPVYDSDVDAVKIASSIECV